MKKYFFLSVLAVIAMMLSSCVKDEPVVVPDPTPPPPPGSAVLIHYWHFNNLPNEAITTPVEADFSQFGLTASMTYPGTGEGYVDIRTHRDADPVSNFNLRMGQAADQGAVLRLRNPANTRQLLIEAPTNGFKELVVTFATTRTENGAKQQEFHISADGGQNWTKVGETYNVPSLPENEGYLEKVIDLSEFQELNDNANAMFRILFVGEGADNLSGNSRMDNFSVDGVPLDGAPASKLAVTDVNEGQPVKAGEPFSLLIFALNANNNAVAVQGDVTITLSVENGSGTLSGTTTTVLEAGNSSILITDLLYDIADTGVQIRASADGLESGISEPFDIEMDTYSLKLTLNIANAAGLTGAGDYAEGDEVTIEAIPNSGFDFINWTLNGEEFATELKHTFNMPAEDLEIVANFVSNIPGEPELIHYWHFNDLAPNTPIENPIIENIPVLADFSATETGKITYEGTGDGWWDTRSHREQDPVSNFNLRLDQQPDEGNVLRVRNPADTRALIFEVPSSGYRSLVVTFATTRTTNGAQEQEFYHSADGGNTWTLSGEAYTVNNLDAEEGYTEKIIDLSGIESLNDNPNLMFKIMFVGEGSANTSGNNRFDNFSVDGIPVLK